jgi:hypothetical protein
LTGLIQFQGHVLVTVVKFKFKAELVMGLVPFLSPVIFTYMLVYRLVYGSGQGFT